MNVDQYLKRIAMAQVALADKIEKDFVATHGGLATYLLATAREQASDAMISLADVDPNDTKAIMHLQNEVQRFRDLSEWMSRAVEQGNEAWNHLDAGEQAVLTDMINPQETEDA